MRCLWACLAAAVLTVGGAASAATVQHLSLGELAERSEQVLIGTVIRQESRLERDPVQIFTDTELAVERVLKGPREKGPPLVLTQLGGTAGAGTERRTQRIAGYPEFAVGERVLVFLERTDTGRLVVTGLAQGKYTLVTDPKSGETLAVRAVHGLHYVGQRQRPQAVIEGAPVDPDRVPLGQLLDIIDGRRPRAVAPRVLGPVTPQVTLPAQENAR